LTCRGLNRALALPMCLLPRYGKPQFFFRRPTPPKKGGIAQTAIIMSARSRTIEPTAIRCGLPVNTQFRLPVIKGIERELEKPAYQNATGVCRVRSTACLKSSQESDSGAWSCKHHGGDPAQVPYWPRGDYDTIFVFKINNDAGQESFSFTIEPRRLNNRSDTCP